MKVVILGAGLAGLGAGLALQQAGIACSILEAAPTPGGLARTDVMEDCYFDYTGHFLHIKTAEGYQDLIEQTVPFLKIKRESAVVVGHVTVPYPIQFNLRHLDPVTVRNIVAEITAIQQQESKPAGTLTGFIKGHFGPTLFNLFFKPYNEKLWGKPLSALPHNCLGNYFPKIDLDLLLKGCEEETAYKGYNDFFYYPRCGRIGAMPELLADRLQGHISFSTPVKWIDVLRKTCYSDQGRKFKYDHLVSSIPLHELMGMLNKRTRSIRYHYTSIHNIRIIARGKVLHPYHWLYIPDTTLPAYRIGFPSNIMDGICPDGYVSLSLEVNTNRLTGTLQEIAGQTMAYLSARGLIHIDKVLTVADKLISPAYTYVSKGQQKELDDFSTFLHEHDIHAVGRYGLWKYYSMEEAYLSGKHAAKRIMAAPPSFTVPVG